MLKQWVDGSVHVCHRTVRRSAARLVCEQLEVRLCLSGAEAGALSPRLGNSPLFHTPILIGSAPGQAVPRLHLPKGDSGPTELLELDDGLVVFLTSEADQGRDLNGDGDKRDHVLQSFDARRGRVRNSRQAAIPGSLVDLGGGRVGFLTDEAQQGRSLNRDGDKLDQVLQVFDAKRGGVRNTRQSAVAESIVALGDGLVAFVSSESAEGRVLNGDGDKLDLVLQSFDFDADRLHNSGQQADSGSLVDIGDGFVAFHTRESAQGTSLNGDGDKLDTVLQTFDAQSGRVQNSGRAV